MLPPRSTLRRSFEAFPDAKKDAAGDEEDQDRAVLTLLITYFDVICVPGVAPDAEEERVFGSAITCFCRVVDHLIDSGGATNPREESDWHGHLGSKAKRKYILPLLAEALKLLLAAFCRFSCSEELTECLLSACVKVICNEFFIRREVHSLALSAMTLILARYPPGQKQIISTLIEELRDGKGEQRQRKRNLRAHDVTLPLDVSEPTLALLRLTQAFCAPRSPAGEEYQTILSSADAAQSFVQAFTSIMIGTCIKRDDKFEALRAFLVDLFAVRRSCLHYFVFP
eukprot:GHVU01016029.1.p1 GENE.GHVU01016029.1~~GHVU01016029.1.p1  ORF type:complete len:284 (-),score=36.03 GHVU01016029.1:530-1381(-)